MNLDAFLQTNNIDQNTWQKSALEWGVLDEIAKDYESQLSYLTDSAEFFARVIQRFDSVHSVRWRVKSTDHLLAKIVRKRFEGSEKYRDINKVNYFEKVTDLVGIRALHLFKNDCFIIDKILRGTWQLSEKAIAYIREGDPHENFESADFEVKHHSAGYRSVHYVCKTQPLSRIVYTEIQIRTIFEEGWSEIDHRVRYPNFSDDQLIAYFLTIFNRLAGSADEMGTFVQELAGTLTNFESRLEEANKQTQDALSKMQTTLNELENQKQEDAATKQKVRSLQADLNNFRELTSSHSLTKQISSGSFDRWIKAPGAFATLEAEAQRLLRNQQHIAALRYKSKPGTSIDTVAKNIPDEKSDSDKTSD